MLACWRIQQRSAVDSVEHWKNEIRGKENHHKFQRKRFDQKFRGQRTPAVVNWPLCVIHLWIISWIPESESHESRKIQNSKKFSMRFPSRNYNRWSEAECICTHWTDSYRFHQIVLEEWRCSTPTRMWMKQAIIIEDFRRNGKTAAKAHTCVARSMFSAKLLVKRLARTARTNRPTTRTQIVFLHEGCHVYPPRCM